MCKTSLGPLQAIIVIIIIIIIIIIQSSYPVVV